jgi:hypothetical protein
MSVLRQEESDRSLLKSARIGTLEHGRDGLISNPTGLAILSRLDSLRNETKDLQERMARYDRILDSFLAQRHNVLDDWAGQPRDPDAVWETHRNGVAHGGSIVMDIEAIMMMFKE